MINSTDERASKQASIKLWSYVGSNSHCKNPSSRVPDPSHQVGAGTVLDSQAMYEQTCPELLKWIIIDQQNEVSFLVSRCQLHITQVSYICRRMVDYTSAGVLKV